ncbi:hypothetical protein BGW41_007110, partial [Actinomortierella wolfii]
MSSNTPTSSSTNTLFEEQADYLLQRHTWPFEKLLESFNRRYRFDTSGSLSDALIKSAKRILNREPEDGIKSWAENLISSTKSRVFREWYRKQQPERPDKIINRAGRQHVKQVVGEVSQSFSSVTSALGRSARSQLPALPSSECTAVPGQIAESSTFVTTGSKRSREQQTFMSEDHGEEHEHQYRPDKQRHRSQSIEWQRGRAFDFSEDSFKVDPGSFELQDYKFSGVDVGSLFLDFQRRSTGLVNRLDEGASMFNLRSFL